MSNEKNKAWTCKYCGKDTSNVEYDYLFGYDHLQCALKSEMENDNKDCESEFKINDSEVLSVFRKYGIVSEKPIDLYSFVKDIDKCIYNKVTYKKVISNK